MNKYGCWILMLYFILIAIVVSLLFSCNPSKQATRLAHKALKKDTVAAIKVFRDAAPCVITYRDTGKVIYKPGRIDTVRKPQIITVDCPDNSPGAKPGATIPVKVNAPCNCEERAPDTAYIPITWTVEDSSKVIEANIERDKAKNDVTKYQGRAKTKGWIIAVLIGLFILYILLTKTFKFF